MKSSLTAWKTISSKRAFETNWLSLREETCRTASGHMIEPYYVIDCRDWVCVIAITEHDELILVRQYRHGAGAITLELPAGEIDAGETAEWAAQRELAEETGYTGVVERLGATSPNPARYSNTLHIVWATSAQARAETKADPQEEIEIVLWPMSRIRELFTQPCFLNSSQTGALATALVAKGRL